MQLTQHESLELSHNEVEELVKFLGNRRRIHFAAIVEKMQANDN